MGDVKEEEEPEGKVDEVEVQKLLQEVGSLFFPDTYMAFLFWLFFLYFLSHILFLYFFFQGLRLLRRESSLKEEACQLEEEAQCLETEGLGKA